MTTHPKQLLFLVIPGKETHIRHQERSPECPSQMAALSFPRTHEMPGALTGTKLWQQIQDTQTFSQGDKVIWPTFLPLKDPEPHCFQTHHPNNQGITQSTALPQTPEQHWDMLAVASPRVSSNTSTKSRETEWTWEKCSTQMGIQLIKYWAGVHRRYNREQYTNPLDTTGRLNRLYKQ